MDAASIMMLIGVIDSLLGIVERNRANLSDEGRKALHARTAEMVERAKALAASA